MQGGLCRKGIYTVDIDIARPHADVMQDFVHVIGVECKAKNYHPDIVYVSFISGKKEPSQHNAQVVTEVVPLLGQY